MQSDTATKEISSMTRLQKLAALLIILGPESAAQLLKNFDERELEAVTVEMSRLSVISQEVQEEILGEFGDVAVDAGTGVPGGVSAARKTLEKSVGASRAADIINRVAPTPVTSPAMQQIIELDPRALSHLLAGERPQTIALVASCLPNDKCSRLLLSLPPDVRNGVVERLATLAPTPVEVIEKVVSVLGTRANSKPARALNHTGGIKNAVQILKSIGRNLSQTVLADLERRNPELGQALRERMFVFEDLASLDTMSLQKIMREVELRDLAVALSTAPESLLQALLSTVSRRAGEAIRDEINMLGAQRPNVVRAARTRILEVAHQLETLGEVDLGPAAVPTHDEVLV